MVKTIYLAGGCFWGTDHLFSLVTGVVTTTAGFANSIVPNPTYQDVCSGATHAAETVKVDYEEEKIGLAELLDLFFKSIDPLSLNRQGADVGTQYRTGIFYTDPADLPTITTQIAKLQTHYSEPIAVEVKSLDNFYPAEEYHQDYLYKNPQGYCHVNVSLFDLARTLGKVLPHP